MGKKRFRIGYIPGFGESFEDEVLFAKKHFDYIELTLDVKEGFKEYSKREIAKMKKTIGGFEVLGHMHWEINLSRANKAELIKVRKALKIYKELSVQYCTVHSSVDKDLNPEQNIKGNLKSFKEICGIGKKLGIRIAIENGTKNLFSDRKSIWLFLKRYPSLKLTLDVGHASMKGDSCLKQLLRLGNRVEHIHLHGTIGDNDHLQVKCDKELRRLLKKIDGCNKVYTITLEVFFKMIRKKKVKMSIKERRDAVLRHLQSIRSLGY